MDASTLFAANAIVLLVMAGGFFAAWTKQRDEACWPSWIGANLSLAAAVLLFIVLPADMPRSIALPHCLLVLGFGLRWRAARLFTRSSFSWLSVLLPLIATIALFALPFSAGAVFALVNIILAAQAACTAWHFWVTRERNSPSSRGLVVAYGVMALSFTSRIAQGLVFADQFHSYLPFDAMLQVHLLLALIHVSASGAFALAIGYERMAAELRAERDKVMAEARALARLAECDALTGLKNRRAIEPRLDELRGAGFDTVAVLDLDHFKAVNDRHGHGKGDDVLRAVALALAPDRDCLAARLGGEEFMLLMRGRDSRRRAEQRRRAIPTRVAAEVTGLDSLVTASMGLVELPRRGLQDIAFDDLYSAADRLLYEAKQGGRNRTLAEKLTLFPAAPPPRVAAPSRIAPLPLAGAGG